MPYREVDQLMLQAKYIPNEHCVVCNIRSSCWRRTSGEPKLVLAMWHGTQECADERYGAER